MKFRATVIKFPGWICSAAGEYYHAGRKFENLEAFHRYLNDVAHPSELDKTIRWQLRRYPHFVKQYVCGGAA